MSTFNAGNLVSAPPKSMLFMNWAASSWYSVWPIGYEYGALPAISGGAPFIHGTGSVWCTSTVEVSSQARSSGSQ